MFSEHDEVDVRPVYIERPDTRLGGTCCGYLNNHISLLVWQA